MYSPLPRRFTRTLPHGWSAAPGEELQKHLEPLEGCLERGAAFRKAVMLCAWTVLRFQLCSPTQGAIKNNARKYPGESKSQGHTCICFRNYFIALKRGNNL